MRIVSASFKAPGVPRPKALALSAEHLITSLCFVNQNLAIWTGFSIALQKSNGSDRVRIANMKRVVVRGLEFATVHTGVLVTCGTLPSGRHETVALGISTPMNELLVVLVVLIGLVMRLTQ